MCSCQCFSIFVQSYLLYNTIRVDAPSMECPPNSLPGTLRSVQPPAGYLSIAVYGAPYCTHPLRTARKLIFSHIFLHTRTLNHFSLQRWDFCWSAWASATTFWYLKAGPGAENEPSRTVVWPRTASLMGYRPLPGASVPSLLLLCIGGLDATMLHQHKSDQSHFFLHLHRRQETDPSVSLGSGSLEALARDLGE